MAFGRNDRWRTVEVDEGEGMDRGQLRSRKVVAISQSSYIPWKGYFDLIARADEFILLDDVQYTRRDWRNRNRIKTPHGPRWITVPVHAKGVQQQGTPICEIEVTGHDWARDHWRLIQQAYRDAPFLREYAERLESLYETCAAQSYLSAINRMCIEAVMSLLGISTTVSWSMDYPSSGRRTEKLLELCLAASGTEYLAGPRSRNYLDEGAFENAGLCVTYMDYSGYESYRQLHGAFDHHVSVVDLLLNVGPEAPKYMDAKNWRSR